MKPERLALLILAMALAWSALSVLPALAEPPNGNATEESAPAQPLRPISTERLDHAGQKVSDVIDRRERAKAIAVVEY